MDVPSQSCPVSPNRLAVFSSSSETSATAVIAFLLAPPCFGSSDPPASWPKKSKGLADPAPAISTPAPLPSRPSSGEGAPKSEAAFPILIPFFRLVSPGTALTGAVVPDIAVVACSLPLPSGRDAILGRIVSPCQRPYAPFFALLKWKACYTGKTARMITLRNDMQMSYDRSPSTSFTA